MDHLNTHLKTLEGKTSISHFGVTTLFEITSRIISADIKALAKIESCSLVTAVERQYPPSHRHKICWCIDDAVCSEVGICCSTLSICSDKR